MRIKQLKKVLSNNLEGRLYVNDELKFSLNDVDETLEVKRIDINDDGIVDITTK